MEGFVFSYLWCLCLHDHSRGPGGEGEFRGWGCFGRGNCLVPTRVVDVPSVSKSPQSGDHHCTVVEGCGGWGELSLQALTAFSSLQVAAGYHCAL